MNASIEKPDPLVLDAWYIGAQVRELRDEPLAAVICGIPIVLFRAASGQVVALRDRCPHRGVPLSMGQVEEGQLVCPYHGWTFDGDGHCVAIPGLVGGFEASTRGCQSFPVREAQGFIWVWPSASEPSGQPHVFQRLDDPDYFSAVEVLEAESSLHAYVENTLDVPHTAVLHRGLFRNDGARNRIRVELERSEKGVVCQYLGEPAPRGIVGRVLSPSGGEVEHYDRFLLPSIVQVEYSMGTENNVLLDAACTPVSKYFTKIYAVVNVRTRIPNILLQTFMRPILLRVFRQDAEILSALSENAMRHGDESMVSTELDLVGPHVLRLLRRAARGESGELPVYRRALDMDA